MALDNNNAINENISNDIKTKVLEESKILCFHCKRTKSNGKSCIGKCIADTDY